MMGTRSEMSYHLTLIDIPKFLIFTLTDWEKLRLMEVTSVLLDARAISTTNKISEIKHEWQRLMMILRHRKEGERHM